MINETQKLVRVRDLFRNSWNIYKKDFRKFLVIAVIFGGITGLILTFVGLEIPKFFPKAGVQPIPIPAQGKCGDGICDEFEKANPNLCLKDCRQTTPAPAFMPTKAQPLFTLPLYLFLPVILATLLIGVLGAAVLISAVKEVPQEWKIRDVLKKGWSKYLSFLLVSFLTGLAVGLGLLLFVIPGIIFSIWFAFSTYIVICEDKRGFKALSRSKELAKGHWWSIAKRVFAIMIIALPLSLGSLFIPYLGQFAFTILFAPFSIIYSYLIYQNLKEIKGTTLKIENI